MIKSQLIDLLQHFNTEELQEFQFFVDSPYFNRGYFIKETQSLLAFITSTAPDFQESALRRDEAYKAVFPGMPVVEGKLDKVMSDLHKLAKEFIAVNHYMREANEFRRLLDQAVFYRSHALDSRHHNIIQKLESYQNDLVRLDKDFFQRSFLLNFEIHSYENLHNLKRGDVHIPQTLSSLDLQYFLIKTELLNQYLLQQKVARLDIPEEIVQAIGESNLPERYADRYPILLISYKIFRLLEKEQTDVPEFEELHGLLRQHEEAIQPELLKSYFTYIRNICVLLVNSGRSEFLPILFTFQKEHFERGYLHYSDKISPSAFLSTSNTALRLGDFAWAEHFITSQQGRIHGDNDSQDYYHLIYANFLFYTGEYNRALDVLPQAFQELDYHIFSRRLELKIYYELESDLLPYKIDSFKMYLSRASQKVISSLTREQNTNFVNLLFQLSTTVKGDAARARRLIERIEAKQSITDREWLLEKAAQLK